MRTLPPYDIQPRDIQLRGAAFGARLINCISAYTGHATTLRSLVCGLSSGAATSYNIAAAPGSAQAAGKEESECLPVDASLLLRKLHGEPRDAAAHLEGQRS